MLVVHPVIKKLKLEKLKTLQIDLLEPTKRKKERLDWAMEQFCYVADEAAKRMPSVDWKYVKSPKGKHSPFYGWVQEFRSKGVEINAQTCQEAIDKARSSYLSMERKKKVAWANYYRRKERAKDKTRVKKPERIPRFTENNLIRFHNRQLKFEKKNGRFFVRVPIKPREFLWLPLKGKQYQYKFLEDIIDGKLEHGVGEIKRYEEGNYVLNLTLRKRIDKKEIGSSGIYAGLDMGLRNLAVLVVKKGDKFLKVKFWSGMEAGYIREKYKRMREELARKGKGNKIKELKNRESKWMDNLNHNISREIADILNNLNVEVLFIERNLNSIKARKRCKKMNRILHSWAFGDLREKIDYKTKANLIEVNPKNTSLMCNKCGHVEKGNRNGITFKCKKCGYQANADFNAAVNILNKGVEELYASRCGLPSCSPYAPPDDHPEPRW